jgi:hypothetical protein
MIDLNPVVDTGLGIYFSYRLSLPSFFILQHHLQSAILYSYIYLVFKNVDGLDPASCVSQNGMGNLLTLFRYAITS